MEHENSFFDVLTSRINSSSVVQEKNAPYILSNQLEFFPISLYNMQRIPILYKLYDYIICE